MDYICYISRTKIDQLHQQVDSALIDDVKEQFSTELSRVGELGIFPPKFLGFKGGLTYGRKNTIQLERKVKTAYVEKLRDVIMAIYADHGDIPDIGEAVAVGDLNTIFYYYDGLFSAEPFPFGAPITASTIVQIKSKTESFTLSLDCSLRFFSEASDTDLIHSGNSYFFRGGAVVRMAGVFIFLSREKGNLFGSPLYLKLSAQNSIMTRDAL
jgi:hypothetical protein